MGVAWHREVNADGSSTTGVADRATKNTSNNTTSAMTTKISFFTRHCSSQETKWQVKAGYRIRFLQSFFTCDGSTLSNDPDSQRFHSTFLWLSGRVHPMIFVNRNAYQDSGA